MGTNKIIKEISLGEFKELLVSYTDKMVVGRHTLDHLSNAQRKIFKEEELVNPLMKETPQGVGLQANGRYSAFFRRKEGYLRIIFEAKKEKLEIITFTNPDTMPNLKRL